MIVTPSLILRRFSVADAASVFEMSGEAGMREWIPDQAYENENVARTVLQHLIDCYEIPGDPRRGPFVLGICLRATSALVGHVGLSPLRGDVEIGYAVEERRQGHGLATEAVSLMCEFGFARFELPRILGVVHTDNAGSCRVLEKAGFTLVNEEAGILNGKTGLLRTYERTRP
jgi:ribosomal-protein-alanine N-acetyltransferase